MKFRVKKYENYVVLWPDSNLVKKVYTEGQIVDLESIKNDNQAYKLEALSKEEIEELEKESAQNEQEKEKPENQDGANQERKGPPSGSNPKPDSLKDQLRGGKNDAS